VAGASRSRKRETPWVSRRSGNEWNQRAETKATNARAGCPHHSGRDARATSARASPTPISAPIWGSHPPTPPCVRARIRRLGGLSWRLRGEARHAERIKEGIGQGLADRRLMTEPSRSESAASGSHRSVATHAPLLQLLTRRPNVFHCFQTTHRARAHFWRGLVRKFGSLESANQIRAAG
jgi:hypothetical protein